MDPLYTFSEPWLTHLSQEATPKKSQQSLAAMHWYPGAGHFSLLILCFMTRWAPSQETPVPNVSDLVSILLVTQSAANETYEFYLKEESSLENQTESPPYEPQLNLSMIHQYTSTFLQELKRIENFTTNFHQTLINKTTYLILQLNLLQMCLFGTDTVTPRPVGNPEHLFDKKLFALNTLKRFSIFMTHLYNHPHHWSDEGKATFANQSQRHNQCSRARRTRHEKS